MSINSLKASPKLMASNEDLIMENQIILNPYQNFPNKNSWNYICNSYIFDSKLNSNFETTLISNDASYMFRHILTRIKIDNYERDFRKERILVYFKNTDYLIRGNVFKIFANLNNDLFKQHLFTSMFSKELIIKYPNFIVRNYTGFVKSSFNKNFYDEIDSSNSIGEKISTNDESTWAYAFEKFFSDNNYLNFYFKDFYFPNIFQYIDYGYVYESDFVLQEDIPKNYLDRQVFFNLSNYIQALIFNLENFFDKINFGNFDYTKSFFNETINDKEDFYKSVVEDNSYLLLTNNHADFDSIVNSNIMSKSLDTKEEFLRIKNNLLYMTRLRNIIYISNIDLFSYNFFCLLIKDKFGKNIFMDIKFNPFKNFSPNKVLKLNATKFGLSSDFKYDPATKLTTPYSLVENLNIYSTGGFDNQDNLANCFWFNMNFDYSNKISEKQQNRRNNILGQKNSLFEIEYTFFLLSMTKNFSNITSNIKISPKNSDQPNIEGDETLFEINLETTDYSDYNLPYLLHKLKYTKKNSTINYNNGWNHICLFIGSEVKNILDPILNSNVPIRYLKLDFYLNDLKYPTIEYNITKFSQKFLDSKILFDYKIKSIYENLHLSNYKLFTIEASDINREFAPLFNTTLETFNIEYMYNLVRYINLNPKFDLLINNYYNFKNHINSILAFNFEVVNIDNYYLADNNNNIIQNYFRFNEIDSNLYSNFSFPNNFLMNEYINFNSKSKFVNVFAKGYPYFKYLSSQILIIIKLDADYVMKAFKKNVNDITLDDSDRDYFLIKVNNIQRIVYFNDAFNEHEFYHSGISFKKFFQLSILFNPIKNAEFVYTNKYPKSFNFYFVTKIPTGYKFINFQNDFQIRGNYKFSKFEYEYESLDDFSKNFVLTEPRSKIENFLAINTNPNYKDTFIKNITIFDPKLIEKNLTIEIIDEDVDAVDTFNLINFSIEEISSMIKENIFIDFDYFRSDNGPIDVPFNFFKKELKEGSWIIDSSNSLKRMELYGYLPLIYDSKLEKVDLQYYTNEVYFNLAMIIKYHDYYFEDILTSESLQLNLRSKFFKDEVGFSRKNFLHDNDLIYNDENQRYSYMASRNIITVKNNKNFKNNNNRPLYFTIYINNPDIISTKKLDFSNNLQNFNREEKRNYNLKITLVNAYKMYLTYKIELEEIFIQGGPQEHDTYNNENISFLINFKPNLNFVKRENINEITETIYLGNEIDIKIFIEKIKFKNIRWNYKLPDNSTPKPDKFSFLFNIEYIFTVNSLLFDIVFSKKEFYTMIEEQTNKMKNYPKDKSIGKFPKNSSKFSRIKKIFDRYEIKEYKENVFALILKNVPQELLYDQVFNLDIDISKTIKGYFGTKYEVNTDLYFSSNSRKIDLISDCNRDAPFIWKKSNFEYIENPINLELSIFLSKMSLFLNPLCLSQLVYMKLYIGFFVDENHKVNYYFSSYIKTIFFPNYNINLFISYKYLDEIKETILTVNTFIIKL